MNRRFADDYDVYATMGQILVADARYLTRKETEWSSPRPLPPPGPLMLVPRDPFRISSCEEFIRASWIILAVAIQPGLIGRNGREISAAVRSIHHAIAAVARVLLR